MKCKSCGYKFPKKSIRKCLHLDAHLCQKCNLLGKGNHRCDLSCPHGKFPQINTRPLSSAVIGMNPTGEIRGVINEFLPRGFNYITCQVNKIRVHAKKLQKIHIAIDFILDGATSIQNDLYSSEAWKWQHIEGVLKSRKTKESSIISPTFCLYLWEGLRVVQESAKLNVNSKERNCFPNQDVDFVGLPDCYPPLTEQQKPNNEKFSFFVGKFTCFYTPFVLRERYHLEFDIEAMNFYYDIGFLFPYRYVDIKTIEYSADLPIMFPFAGQMNIHPIREDAFPPKQEYEWAKHKAMASDGMRPWVVPADPFRKTPLLGIGDKQKLVDTDSTSLSEYDLLLLNFPIATQKDKDLIIDVEVTESALPVRVYNQLQRLPRYNDKLISFDIINFSKKTIDLEIASEISGYTELEITNCSLPPMGGGKSSRQVISQCPKLKRGVLATVNHAVEATLKYEIYFKNNGERKLYERGTKPIKLLPHDMIVWEIKDAKGVAEYDLSKFIGAWITPNDEAGLLDRVRGEAKKYHPDGVLVGNDGKSSLEQINLQVKALYDYLNEKSGISYVNQAFNFGFGTGAQRVLLPERVLKAKTGNCIDLTVLFASLMESMGINPYLMFMPGHAFLAWGNKYDKNNMGFLETTTLGAKDPKTGEKISFGQSFDHAKSVFLNKFILQGADNYIPIYSITFSKEMYKIVDLEEVRKNGIFYISEQV